MNELIMPHNAGVKRVLESMKEVLALYKNVTGCYRPLVTRSFPVLPLFTAEFLLGKRTNETISVNSPKSVVLYKLFSSLDARVACFLQEHCQ